MVSSSPLQKISARRRRQPCPRLPTRVREGLLTLIAKQDRVITAYDRGIEELIADDADHARRFWILQSVPGIGPVTAAALICWINELGIVGYR